MEQVAGIVLCGGRSTRMGQPKHLLPFGEEVALQRVVRIVSSVVSPVVVVAAPHQELPSLPGEIEIVHDDREHLGPLAGLSSGLETLEGRAEAAYLSGCDVPLLRPEFVREIIGLMRDEDDVVVPSEEQYLHPLAAVYRRGLLQMARQLIAEGNLRPRSLIEGCRARIVPVEDLRRADPELDSLRNMNRWEDYQHLLGRAGL